MHEPAPIPPDPESERRGHELRDVAIKPILYFLIGLFVFGGVIQGVMSLIMNGYVAQGTRTGSLKLDSLRDTGDVGDNIHPAPAPALQRNTTADMLSMYDEENAVLNQKSPAIDRRTKKVVVSIDRAMQIIAKKGLPHRDTAPSAIDRELPYPKRSSPYMATP